MNYPLNSKSAYLAALERSVTVDIHQRIAELRRHAELMIKSSSLPTIAIYNEIRLLQGSLELWEKMKRNEEKASR